MPPWFQPGNRVSACRKTEGKGGACTALLPPGRKRIHPSLLYALERKRRSLPNTHRTTGSLCPCLQDHMALLNPQERSATQTHTREGHCPSHPLRCPLPPPPPPSWFRQGCSRSKSTASPPHRCPPPPAAALHATPGQSNRISPTRAQSSRGGR